MKLFINDWDGDTDKFVMNTEENREYPINAWVPAGDGNRVYLVSAYVYNEFVMFFYMYDLSHNSVYSEQRIFKMPETQRESIEQTRSHMKRSSRNFEYEVNHLKPGSGRGGECLPRQPFETVPPEAEQDEFMKMYFGEYDYLCGLMKDRIPDELKDKKLAFKKDCYSFEEPISEVSHIAVYPSSYQPQVNYIDKTFTAPYGSCDIKIPYTLPDTGEESYIIIKELKIENLLDSFEENYDMFKQARENTLREIEENKGNHRKNQSVMDLDEIRKIWDVRILTISFLKPEEKRSFEFYTTNYLDSKVATIGGSSTLGVAYLFKPDAGDIMEDGLYKAVSRVTDEACDEPKAEYEIVLTSVTDTLENERKAILEMNF